jgi:hypothetical protein
MPGSGEGSGMAPALPHEIIEMTVPLIHLGALHRLEHEIGRVFSPMRTLCGGSKPVILIGGHQNEFTPPMPGDFDGLFQRAMLHLAELALEFEGCDPGHKILLIQIIRIIRVFANPVELARSAFVILPP